ncbi:MAG: Rab family GTPase [Candidatus Asgardarchaeia archaeon]
MGSSIKIIKVYCDLCKKDIEIEIREDKVIKYGFPLVITNVHGEPPHTIKLIIGEGYEVLRKDIIPKPVTLKTVKAIIIGDAMVGKTSLINRFVEKTFNPAYIATIGVSVSLETLSVDETPVNLFIWDIAGQERFHLIRQVYYKGAKVAAVVYDITNPESFKNILKWIDEMKRYSGDIPFIIVGNKIDLENFRKISREEAEELSERLGVPYIETSALTGHNVPNLFYSLAKMGYKVEEE